MKPKKFFHCVVCGLIVSTVCFANDWPEFRGPTGSFGRASVALPTTWSEDENIVWKVPTEGIGWSSPVIASGAIYLTTSVGEGDGLKSPQSLRVVRVDGETGKEVWNKEVFKLAKSDIEIHKKNSHASPTPILEDNRLYVHFGPGGTACLDLDGKVIWKKKLKYAPLHGNGGSPAIAGGMLIINCDGRDVQYVVGMDKNTGGIKWKKDRNTKASRGFSFCTPTIIEAAGQTQAICPGSGKVISYDPETGDELWHVNYGEGYSVVPRPVFANGLVYVCSGFTDKQIFAIDPSGEGDVTDTHVKWQSNRGVPMSPSVLVIDQELYMVSDNGIATCLNAMTGDELWKQRLGGKFSASPTFADGLIYFIDEYGKTTVVRAGREYEEVAVNKLLSKQERSYATFAVLKQDIILRSENHLYRIGNKR